MAALTVPLQFSYFSLSDSLLCIYCECPLMRFTFLGLTCFVDRINSSPGDSSVQSLSHIFFFYYDFTYLNRWFSGITELVNNVLQPQLKSQNEKEPEPDTWVIAKKPTSPRAHWSDPQSSCRDCIRICNMMLPAFLLSVAAWVLWFEGRNVVDSYIFSYVANSYFCVQTHVCWCNQYIF